MNQEKCRVDCNIHGVVGPTWLLIHLSRHAALFKSYWIPLAKVTLQGLHGSGF